MKHGLLRFNALRSAHLDFCATELFRGTVIDFCFMFTEVLMKNVARKLIHVQNTFDCRVSFQNAVFNVPCNYLEETLNIAVIK